MSLQVSSQIGRWTLQGPSPRPHYWWCKCECGNYGQVYEYQLLKGKSKSCGCFKTEPAPSRQLQLRGMKFGKLHVIKQAGRNKHGRITWTCQCDCGRAHVVEGSLLKAGSVKSCGCGQQDGIVKLGIGEAAFNRVFTRYKASAKKSNRIFALTKEQFYKLTQQPCHYCSEPPTNQFSTLGSRTNGVFSGNGVDRVDNSKGYTHDNCVPCCVVCNRAKKDMPLDKFIEWAKNLVFNI